MHNVALSHYGQAFAPESEYSAEALRGGSIFVSCHIFYLPDVILQPNCWKARNRNEPVRIWIWAFLLQHIREQPGLLRCNLNALTPCFTLSVKDPPLRYPKIATDG